MEEPSKKTTITASEVANYVVCPEAWRLKYLGLGSKRQTPRVQQGQKLREEWVQKQDLSSKLSSYAKVAYLMLIAIVIVVFFLDKQRQDHKRQPQSKSKVEAHGLR